MNILSSIIFLMQTETKTVDASLSQTTNGIGIAQETTIKIKIEKIVDLVRKKKQVIYLTAKPKIERLREEKERIEAKNY